MRPTEGRFLPSTILGRLASPERGRAGKARQDECLLESGHSKQNAFFSEKKKKKGKGRVKSRAVAFVLSRNSSGKLQFGPWANGSQAPSASQPPGFDLSLASDFSGPFFYRGPALHRLLTYDGPFCAPPALHPSRPDRAAIRALLECLDTSLIAALFFFILCLRFGEASASECRAIRTPLESA